MFRYTLCKVGEAPKFCPGYQAYSKISKVNSFDKTIDITSLRW